MYWLTGIWSCKFVDEWACNVGIIYIYISIFIQHKGRMNTDRETDRQREKQNYDAENAEITTKQTSHTHLQKTTVCEPV